MRKGIAFMILAVSVAGLTGCSQNAAVKSEDDAVTKPKAELTVKDVSYATRPGVVRITGMVSNGSSGIRAQKVELEATVKKSGSEEIGTARVGAGDLAPGSSRPFVIEVAPTVVSEDIEVKVVAFEQKEH